MAYTITQQPTSPNAAYTRLLYVVSGSTNTNKPLFQYVMDVYESGSNDLIKRTTQTVNPAGVSVFDPSRIMQGQLSYDYSWYIDNHTPFNSSSKVFTLEFGEQFASSISSSAAVVDNLARTNIEVFQGVVEPNAGYFNWQSGSYGVLSNMPATMSMQYTDRATISIHNPDPVVSNVTVRERFYRNTATGSQFIDAGEYDYSASAFFSVPVLGVQPWDYAEVNISGTFGVQSYRYEASGDPNRERVRFVFINKFGSWDYYSNYNPVRQAFEVRREQYTSPRVDYSSLTSVYDIERRGLNDYHNTTDDEFVVDTDLLDQTTANWLEELIESPSVFIQRNNPKRSADDGIEFIPIVITDSSYVANTNQARQKQFQYTITFKPSNQPYGKWVPEFIECPKITPVTYRFDPYGGGTIAPSSLHYWFDFTDTGTGSMHIGTDSESGYTGIISMSNKGTQTFAIGKPNQATIRSNSGSLFVPPTFIDGDDPHTEFKESFAINTNSSSLSFLASRMEGVGPEDFNIGLFQWEDTTNRPFTWISLHRRYFEGSTSTYSLSTGYEGKTDVGPKYYFDSLQLTSFQENFSTPELDFINYNSASFTNTVSSSTFHFDASGFVPNIADAYSYASSSVGNSVLESSVLVYPGGIVSTNTTGSYSRNYANVGGIIESSSIFAGVLNEPQGYLENHALGLTVAGGARKGSGAIASDVTTTKLDAYHVLIYSGALDPTQIEAVLDSFKLSRPDRLNLNP